MNEDLKDKIAQLLTGGVHYYELNDPMLQDSAMQPEFAARWSSDVVKEVDSLAELFDQELAIRVAGMTKKEHIDNWQDVGSKVAFKNEMMTYAKASMFRKGWNAALATLNNQTKEDK